MGNNLDFCCDHGAEIECLKQNHSQSRQTLPQNIQQIDRSHVKQLFMDDSQSLKESVILNNRAKAQKINAKKKIFEQGNAEAGTIANRMDIKNDWKLNSVKKERVQKQNHQMNPIQKGKKKEKVCDFQFIVNYYY